MEQTLKIIEIISSIAILILIGTLFWQYKSKGSMSCKVTQLALEIVLFALQIPRLYLKKILLNQSCKSTILLLCALVLSIVANSILIVAMHKGLYGNQGDSEGTSDN